MLVVRVEGRFGFGLSARGKGLLYKPGRVKGAAAVPPGKTFNLSVGADHGNVRRVPALANQFFDNLVGGLTAGEYGFNPRMDG